MATLKIFTILGVSSFTVLCQFNNASGAVTIFPSPRAAVCCGGFLDVKYNTNETILRWELMLIGTDSPTVQSYITSTQIFQDTVILHSTVFVFSRASELGAQPLESILEISSVGQNLNGSTITCMEASSAMASMATTTVYIVGENDAYHPSPPEVSFEEQFGVDNVTVVLQWTEELDNSLVTYHVSVEPMAHVIIGNSRANLTLSYNTPYNVSVVADVCGGFNASTTHMVNYVNCGVPSLDGSVLVMGHTSVSLEGDMVSFSCSSGLVLIGPNMSICMRNGEWEPDTRKVACKRPNSHQPLSEGVKIAVTSVSVFFVTFVLAFTVGFLCGHCYRKQKHTSESAEKKLTPLYEAIQPQKHSKQKLTMNENIAYSTTTPIDS